jgi:hypothetical protein
MKNDDLAECENQHGYYCPHCKSSESIKIRVEKWASLFSDGTDTDEGDTEWDHNSSAMCGECDWEGVVDNLIEVDLEEED